MDQETNTIGGHDPVTDVQIPAHVDDERDDSQDEPQASSEWPSKGYDGPQPWQDKEADQVFAHERPVLSSGSAGGHVVELVHLLAELGYPCALTEGTNPFCILGPSELAAVESFRRDYGVREDPTAYPTDSETRTHVGPWTWEALYRATAKS